MSASSCFVRKFQVVLKYEAPRRRRRCSKDGEWASCSCSLSLKSSWSKSNDTKANDVVVEPLSAWFRVGQDKGPFE